jgi:hypothetical protein
MVAREDLLATMAPLLRCLEGLRTDDPAGAEQALAHVDTTALEAALRDAHGAGWLTPREAAGLRFGRLAKATPETSGFSIDVVDMSAAAGGAHTHPGGEFDLCFPLSGSPRFDGRGCRWVVYPPGSRHVPTVTGGRMLIVYFLPGGGIHFETPPSA